MLLQNNPLKKYSNFKIGGPALYFSEFKNKEELISALMEYKSLNTSESRILIIGDGTNILFSDKGFAGLVLHSSIDYMKREGESLEVGGGTEMEKLVAYCSQNSLSGFEWAGGLPGTIGGAIRGNAGAFMGEAKDNVLEVQSLDKASLKVRNRNKKECEFDSRMSIFKKEGDREIILSATFALKKGDREEIKKSTQEKIDYRIDRHPLDLPNIGSTFKNFPVKDAPKEVLKEFESSIKPDPFPVIPAAKLIIGAGMMGGMVGGAKVSEKHPNFIVNTGGAKSSDVMALIDRVRKSIKTKYNVDLELEIMLV